MGHSASHVPRATVPRSHSLLVSRYQPTPLTRLDFAVALVSSAFSGKTQIARHRMVNSLLKDEFDAGLHALSLRLRTPQEWEKEVDAAVAEGKGQ
jgi:stress-induced morphogen